MNVQRSSSYTYQAPTYYSGTANAQRTYNAFGATTNATFNGAAYGGNQVGNTTSWTETLNFPVFDTYFYCTNTPYRVGVELQAVGNDGVRSYSKDLMGAVQITDVLSSSPSRLILRRGDIVLKVGGVRVTNENQFTQAVDRAENKRRITSVIVREGKRRVVYLKAYDATGEFLEDANQLVANACQFPEVQSRRICTVERVVAQTTWDDDEHED